MTNEDLEHIGAACVDMPLVTAGSGVGLGLARAIAQRGPLTQTGPADAPPHVGGRQVVIAGSCSLMTQAQVAAMRAHYPAFTVRADDLMAGLDVTAQALDWAKANLPQGPVLIYSTAPSDDVRAQQQRYGVADVGEHIEQTLATIAVGLVDAGVRRLIVAGGETSGSVVQALQVKGLRIGPEIDPGVPWTHAISHAGDFPLALVLKSGNFGCKDFFLKALAWSS